MLLWKLFFFFLNRAVLQSYVKASLQQKLEKTVFVLFELR